MLRDIFHLAVICTGSDGLAAARWAAERGYAIVVFEPGAIGGTCVDVGFVPKELLVHASRVADHLGGASHLGWAGGSQKYDWPSLASRVAEKVRELSRFHRQRLADLGMAIVEERAALAGPTTMHAGGSVHEARNILIATGVKPLRPPTEGVDHALVSDDMFTLGRLARRLAIIGGGYIAVKLFERAPRLVESFDEDVTDRLLASEAAQIGAIALRSRLTEDELHHVMPLYATLGEEVLGLGRRMNRCTSVRAPKPLEISWEPNS